MDGAAPVRFGILSTAAIAEVFCAAVAAVAGAEVTAVASRDERRARAFADRHGVAGACGYDALLARGDVDAVYVPLPTALADGWAARAAAAGKHVLVDKPFASAAAAARVAAACAAARVAFLDGTHFVHAARMARVRRAVADADPGAPRARHVVASFSHPVDLGAAGAIRADAALEPAGALGDLGWYCARAAVAVLGAEVCERIARASCDAVVHAAHGVVVSAVGFVRFASGETVVMDCSFDGPSRQRFEAVTRTGSVVVIDFVLPLASTALFRDLAPAGAEAADAGEAAFDVEISCAVDDGGKDGDEGGGGGGARAAPRLLFPRRTRVVAREDGTQPERMVRAFCGLVADDAERAFWARESVATQAIVDAWLADAKACAAKGAGADGGADR